MALEVSGVYLLHHIPTDTEKECHILQCHCLEQIHHVFGKSISVGPASRGKWNLFLLVIIAVFPLAFVTLNLHAKDHPLATYGQTNKIPYTVAILDQFVLPALRTYFLSLLCLHMKNNCITFVLGSCTFMAVKAKSVI